MVKFNQIIELLNLRRIKMDLIKTGVEIIERGRELIEKRSKSKYLRRIGYRRVSLLRALWDFKFLCFSGDETELYTDKWGRNWYRYKNLNHALKSLSKNDRTIYCQQSGNEPKNSKGEQKTT